MFLWYMKEFNFTTDLVINKNFLLQFTQCRKTLGVRKTHSFSFSLYSS